MSPRIVPEPEPLWRALADPTRRGILDELRNGPRTTGALVEGFPTTRFTIMRHLDVLVAAGLVTVERRGRERLNHLNPVPLQQVVERWVRPLAEPTATAVLRLAEAAEKGDSMTSALYGLDVHVGHRVDADGERTWKALLGLTGWWPRCWEDGYRLVFEPRVGGRLGTSTGPTFEEGRDGSLWGVVTTLRSGHELAVDGSMGIPGPVLGQWRMRLELFDRFTLVTVEHRVLGHVDDETRDCFTAGWGDTLASLAEHASTSSSPEAGLRA